jgi:hypothetical protein
MQVLSERMKCTAVSMQSDHIAECFVPAVLWVVMYSITDIYIYIYIIYIYTHIQMLWENLLPVGNDTEKAEASKR